MKARWEQDGAGGDNGVGYFELGGVKVQVPLPNFPLYGALHQAIEEEAQAAFTKGRKQLLAQIARLTP